MKKAIAPILATLILGLVAFDTHAADRGASASLWLQWESAGEAGFDAGALEATRKFADNAHSAAVLAVYDGHVLAAWGAVDRKLELHSVRKSLYSAMWGIAASRKLADLDATLEKLGIDDVPALTEQEKQVRIADLLAARSGVYHASAYAPSVQEETLPARGSHAPGTFWFYNNWDFNVAGAMLERAAHKPLGTLFGDWIATPIGMDDYRPDDVFAVLEPHTSRWPALTFRMSARDLARFGLLWLNAGRWNGRQLIPSAWVTRASTAASNTGAEGQGYGLMWWTYEIGSVSAERYPSASRFRIVMGRGTGGQVVAVIPAARMVIVHRADTDNKRSVSGPDVWTIIDRILGAQRQSPKKNPRLVAVNSQPFASQLPALTLPPAVILDRAIAQSLVGDYEIQKGVLGHVYVVDGRLYASMPGRGEAELFALSNTEFFLRIDPSVRLRFETGADGRPTRLLVTMSGREIAARRVEAQ